MDYSRLFILIEGDDDERFIKKVISPLFKKYYNGVITWKYSEKRKIKIKRFLNSIKSMNASFIFLHDFNTADCYTQRIAKLNKTYPFIDGTDIVIVRIEIESWYLAGLDNKISENLGIDNYKSTNDLDKESFNALIPKRFDSRIDFMIEVLNSYSVDIAKSKNNSFQYFVTKFAKKRLPNAFH